MTAPVVTTSPFADNESDPAVAEIPAVDIPLLLVTDALPVVPLTARVVPAVKDVFDIVLAPALLNTMPLPDVVSVVAPVPPFKFIAAPLTLNPPADWLIVPAFVAVSVTAVGPVTLPPSEMVPFPAEVEASAVVVVDDTAPVVVMLPAVESDMEPAVAAIPAVDRF